VLLKVIALRLLLPNSTQFVVAFFGALKAGAAVTAINPLHREREVAYQLRDSAAKGYSDAGKPRTNGHQSQRETPGLSTS
jgi:acyl-CoA synthetase (AMP-forming)/AMP-acid ligase II